MAEVLEKVRPFSVRPQHYTRAVDGRADGRADGHAGQAADRAGGAVDGLVEAGQAGCQAGGEAGLAVGGGMEAVGVEVEVVVLPGAQRL